MTDRFKEALILVKQGVITGAYFHVYEEALTLATEAEQLRKERDELAEVLGDILHSAFEHGSKNLSGKTIDPDGEMLWKAKQLVERIVKKVNENGNA